MDEEKMFYNAVAIALDGDPFRVRKLRRQCGNLFDGWKIVYDSLAGAGFERPDLEAEWKQLEVFGVRLVLFGDSDYPELLREMYDPPFGIYVIGDLPAPAQPAISIVGTRRGTPEGKATTRRFARELAGAGFTIASGLALGIDAAAHEGCLEFAAGKTIAVLAGGLDDVYPSTNEWLAEKIVDRGGALISEYPLYSPPFPARFLERNRIVSGLSQGVVVVESPESSGSLVTARLALEQNRDVFVVPGPISHPNFFGSHSLIRQGAELVTSPDDILESYGLLEKNKSAREENIFAGATDEEKQVLIALRSVEAAADVDKIIELTKLEPRRANQALSFLLLKNVIKETETGYIIE